VRTWSTERIDRGASALLDVLWAIPYIPLQGNPKPRLASEPRAEEVLSLFKGIRTLLVIPAEESR
jgi:hypothetical protein